MSMTLENARLRTRRLIDDLSEGSDADAAAGSVRWSTSEVDTALALAQELCVEEAITSGVMMFRQTVTKTTTGSSTVTFTNPPIKIMNLFIQSGTTLLPILPGTPANRNVVNQLISQQVTVDFVDCNTFPALSTDTFTYAGLSINSAILDNYVCAVAAQSLMTKTGEENPALNQQISRLRESLDSKPNSPSMSVMPYSQVFPLRAMVCPYYWIRLSSTEVLIYL